MSLPSDWLGASASGVKSKLGTWTDTSADAAGTAAHFRIKNTAGSVCHMQGTVTATGGGGDLTLITTAVLLGQPVTITTFALTAGGA